MAYSIGGIPFCTAYRVTLHYGNFVDMNLKTSCRIVSCYVTVKELFRSSSSKSLSVH